MTTTTDTPPTERQNQVLEYLRDFSPRHGRPPTIREIGVAMGITSPNGVLIHLRALKRKGFIVHAAGGLSHGWRIIHRDGCCQACGRPL